MERINYLRRGQIAEFVQLYFNDRPKMFLVVNEKNSHGELTRDVFHQNRDRFSNKYLVEYSGSGIITRDNNDVFYVWNDKPSGFNKEHLKDYSKLHKHIKFELR